MISNIFKTFLLSVLVAGQVNFSYAQTASILPPAKTQLLDNNGKPLTSGTVDYYTPGTTTRKTTWQDSGETIPNTNPVVLDGSGRAIMLGDGSYRQVVKDRLGNLIWDQQTSSTGTGGGGTTATVGDGDAVGTVKPWSGLIAPNQYVFSYGQELARTSFPLLFSTLTSRQNVSCTSGSPILTSVGDTSQLPVGAPVESICLNSGATIVSTTISTVTVSSNAIISTNSSATFFPFGNGDGSLTFNTPDLRGRTLAGRDNMGGVAANRLTSPVTGFGAIAALGAVGGNQSTTLAQPNLPNIAPTFTGSSSSVSGTTTGVNVVSGTLVGGFAASSGSSLAVSAGGTSGTVNIAGSTTANGTVASINGNVTQTAFPRVQPTEILNWIIKTLPDTNPNSYFGVASIGGMTGVITCGIGITCTGNNISAVSSVVPSPTSATLGGVFSSPVVANNFLTGIDTSGNILKAQPSAANLSDGNTGTGTIVHANGPTLNSVNITGGLVANPIVGGGAVNSSLTLQGTGNPSPSGDAINVYGATVTIGNEANAAGIINLSGASGGGVTVNIGAAGNGLNALNVFNSTGGKQVWVPGAGSGTTPGTIQFPVGNLTLSTLTGTETLTNKTLTSPTINSGALSGTFSGTPTFSGANFITNSNLPQSPATTIKANPTGATANEQDVTLGSTLNFLGTTLNCTTATTLQIGCSKPDGTTVTISAGILSAVGGVATSIQPGTTTVTGGVANDILAVNSAGTTLTQISVIPAANGGAGTITGALKGNGSGTVSQAATSDLSDVTVPTAWTPSDVSGAGLTFTSVTGIYTRIGKHVVAQFRLTFPSNANGSTVSIGGLPITSSSSGATFSAGMCWSNVATAVAIMPTMAANTSVLSLYDNASATALINSNFTTATVSCSISYISN